MNRRTALSLGLMTAASLAATVLLLVAQGVSSGTTTRHTVEAAGLTRTYYLHLPAGLAPEKAAPLVFLFHGSGDDGLGMESFSKFSTLADREGFIAVYPDAVGKNWNDGREAESIFSHQSKVDDVAFVRAMIRDLRATHRVDPKRIFAAGFSNGGIFIHLLAEQLGNELAAVAAVSGGVAEPLAPTFHPVAPVSVFILHGTRDPFVPYAGGEVDYRNNGRIIGTDDTVNRWLKVIGADQAPATGELPDTFPADHCRVQWSVWSPSKTGAALQLYTIEGAGHTWAGGPQFLPVNVIGEVCRDFDATEAIWDFFRKHPKP